MNTILRYVLAVTGLTIAAQAVAQVTFYEDEGFQGRSFTTERQLGDFERGGIYRRASSADVVGERWEICDGAEFSGRCVVLRPGRYASLASMGLNERVSSVRTVSRDAQLDEHRYAPAPATAAQISFYEGESFQGRSFTTEREVGNFERDGFYRRASSADVVGERWEVCDGAEFSGRCVVLRPGQYASLASMGLNDRVSSVRAVSRNARIADYRYAPAPAVTAQISFFEGESFQGRSFTTEREVGNFERDGFYRRASSADVVGERWEVCDGAEFSGRCVVLRPGRYASLASMGLNDRVSSVRVVSRDAQIHDYRYAPAPVAAGDDSRRDGEQWYEANVTSVRAVVGTPEQRCWIEQEAIPEEQRKASVPGAIVGAIIGGVLGRQVGSGSGQDLATIGGVVAGAAAGSQVGRLGGSGEQAGTQDVQRCEDVPEQASLDYWDVTYNFRGQERRVQMTAPPGPTITVNEQGEPRA